MCDTTGLNECRCQFTKYLKQEKEQDTYSIMRVLFSDHAWLTVQFIQVSIFHISFLTQDTTERLLDNQTQIGKHLGQFFSKIGSKNGRKIGELLRAHILAAAKTTQSAINKSKTFSKDKLNFFKQGDQMSEKLGEILKLNSLQIMKLKKEFRTHNKHVIRLVTYLLTEKSNEFLQELDSYTNHMLHLSDQLVSLSFS